MKSEVMLAFSKPIQLAAITDEFSPDLERSLEAMRSVGMTQAELRMVFGKNILDLTDGEVARVAELLKAAGLQVISIASPILKCTLPDGPPVDDRFQQDVFASRHVYDDQPRLTKRAFHIAHHLGARIVRVFSFWRVVEPDRVLDQVVSALDGLARQAATGDIIIALENEHACNIATAEETARVLKALDHPNLQVVWDPANAYVSGETPFPDGYRQLPPGRIAHVHAKDCRLVGHAPDWCELGTGGVDWRGQIPALKADGYQGSISLETHWKGPLGDKFEASTICAERLRELVGT